MTPPADLAAALRPLYTRVRTDVTAIKNAEGRQAYERALALIGNSPASAAALAYTMADMLTMDYSYGNCSHVEADIQRLVTVLGTQTVSGEMRTQITAGVGTAIQQFRGKTCQPPANLALLQAG